MESATSKDLKARSRIKWQWKSNSDPWSKTEEPQWTSYSPEDNYLIEKAFSDQQKEVDIGEHIVSIQHMIQNKKDKITSQRPIRRVNCEESEDNEINLRSERYFETETPKTINKIFGNLGHFITFFARRNSEILNLTNQFLEFEKLNDLDGLNKIIRPQLIYCLEVELLKPIEDQLQDHSISAFKKKALIKRKGHHQELISLFHEEFASFYDFYKIIFKAYTMNTDLYLNLNRYLRNENWSAIDNLLPYAICLCKAFFSFKPLQEENKLPESSMVLYRGAALDEYTLSSYKISSAQKIFSWNSVTSTSTNREIAERFMYESADISNKKYPVLFIIEIPIVNEAIGPEYLKWIDICQYSAIPKEDEVILAPGCAFELIETSTDEEKRTTIKLKLRQEVESLRHEGLIMQGAFQHEMINNKQIKIMCLEGRELSDAFKSISGNRLIEEIEICLCRFNGKSLEKMMNALPTLEKVKSLKFISCKYEDKQETLKLQDVKTSNDLTIEMSGFQDLYKIFNIQEYNWASWKTLNLNFRNLTTETHMKELNSFFSQGLQNNLTQLTSLTLDFILCEEITDEEVTNLASQGLKNLTQLTSLTLKLMGCFKITEEGVNNLASQGLKHLTQLTSLTLASSIISDQGMNYLVSNGLKYLTKLTSLTLNFYYCNITDDGVSILATEGLQSLTQITSLKLNFSKCTHITDKGIRNLSSHGLKYLTSLTS